MNDDQNIVIKVKRLRDDAIIPKYAHRGDSCVDLYSAEDKQFIWQEVALIHTGIAIEIPEGYEGQIRSRSGNALKNTYIVANSPGTIDSNYRGEIGVIIFNINPKKFVHIKKGDRIAQLVIKKVPKQIVFEEVEELSENSYRGDKGFGSSGQ